jgi:starch phosphorylase
MEGLLEDDHYLVLADFDGYARAQDEVAMKYRQPAAWWKSAILNVARMGFFSSDRTINEYARGIWDIAPVPPGPTEV